MADFDLRQLPDYPALEQLGRALWRNGSVRGASVMVGAGLSKNAVRPGDDTPGPPLWWELLEDMTARIYPHGKKAAPTDPLRIAEEYRNYFGQAGLDDFIRTRFPDRSWSPGPLHVELLDLPWGDVLTTNWDTLLERASETVVDYIYQIVRTEADLTYARSPRIVKLHGSIGDAGPLIFAEEDYRTYPTKYAAFVNLARQVFIENELCLIGFSGSDPNFLQWAGWVRDHLGGAARRIYLVGNLRLERATRKYFESHNIAPIDLAPAVAHLPRDEQHSAATRIFLGEMRKSKPAPLSEWKRVADEDFPLHAAGIGALQNVIKDDIVAAEMLEKTIPLFEADRKNYPGWLVCPGRRRRSFVLQRDNWFFRNTVLSRFSSKSQADAISEFLWRHDVSFEPLDDKLVTTLEGVLDAPATNETGLYRPGFALALMRHARLSRDYVAVDRWAALIEQEAAADAAVRQDAIYQTCLNARDRMDLDGIANGLARLTASDPVWLLRRAALHAEIGNYELATRLIKDATVDLEKRNRLDRNSLWIKSRLGWAAWINRSSAYWNSRSEESLPRQHEFRELEIDPLREVEHIEDAAFRIEKERRKRGLGIRPAFEAGHYREDNAAPSDDGLALLYELDQLIERVGLPLRINHVDVCAYVALAALDVSFEPTVSWYVWLLRSMHSHFDAQFDRYFSRIAVAKLEADTSLELIAIIERAMTHWLGRLKATRGQEKHDDFLCALNTMRLLIMALSRLTVRMAEERAVQTLHLAIRLSQEAAMSHHWLLEALGELAKHAIAATSIATQGTLAFSVINMPLATEIGADYQFWPKLVTSIWKSKPDRDPNDSKWDARIRELITGSAKGKPDRQDAILRISYLALRDALTPSERRDFGQVLWSDLDQGLEPLPTNTGLLATTFAALPAPEGINVSARLQGQLFQTDLTSMMSLPDFIDTRVISERQNFLITLANFKFTGVPMPTDVATRMFDTLLSWVPASSEGKSALAGSFAPGFNDTVSKYAGEILAKVVVPFLPSPDRTRHRFDALLRFVREARAWRALGALPYFVIEMAAAADDAIAAIRSGLLSADFQHSAAAAVAIADWTSLVVDGSLRAVPAPLIEQLVSSIESRHEPGLAAMLSAALLLAKNALLQDGEIARLVTALGKIRQEFRYHDVEPDSVRAVSISLVRAECVKLSVAMQGQGADDGNLQAWIDEAKSDPLPEVRLSLANETADPD